MILTEELIKVPSNKYSLRVRCTATRRLTTIEWLLLTCIDRFSNDYEMQSKQIKYAFEDVLHMTNSEFLIKPCVKNLEKIGVINSLDVEEFEYAKLTFEQLGITERGKSMLREGLLPGESREQAATVYYNPLTGKMNTFEPRINSKKEAIKLGERDDFFQEFPKKEIIDCLQSGNVMGQRFTASKYKIDDVELLNEEDWDNYIELSIGINESSKEIYVDPPFIKEGFYQSVKSLLMVKGLGDKTLQNYSDCAECEVKNIIGSGKRVKNAILNVCRNGNTIILDSELYKIVKSTTTAFKGKTVIFLNAEKFDIISGDFLQISIPENYSASNCAVLNEKKEHVFLATGTYKYNEIVTKIPMAYENSKYVMGDYSLDKWIINTIKKYMSDDIGYLALFSLPVVNKYANSAIKMLNAKWKDSDLNEILKDLNHISSYINTIGENAFNICELKDVIIGKIDFSEDEESLEQIRKIMGLSIIAQNNDNKAYFAKTILAKAKRPKSYVDMLQLYQAVGINSHEFALRFDDDITSIYSEKIIFELISAIMEGKYKKIPEFFEYDVFFNDLHQCIKSVESLLGKYMLFNEHDSSILQKGISECKDIAALKSHIEQLESKKYYLMGEHIDLIKLMSAYNQTMTENFCLNINDIKEILEMIVSNEVEQIMKSEKKKVFVIDTCALIHNPEILNYFMENEYIRIPTKVIDELGKIKDGRSKKYDYELSNTARRVSRDIENSLISMNMKSKFRLMIENSKPELLPTDLDTMVPDNQILSVALKYLDEKPVIISDDGVFRLTSISQEIDTMSGNDFILLHKNKQSMYGNEKIVATKDTGEIEETKGGTDITVGEWAKYPISKLAKVAPVIDNNVVTYLSQNKIRTIGQFFELTKSVIELMPGRAKQAIYKNEINSLLGKKDSLIEKLNDGSLDK